MKKNLATTGLLIALAIAAVVTFSPSPKPPVVPPTTPVAPPSTPDVRTTTPAARTTTLPAPAAPQAVPPGGNRSYAYAGLPRSQLEVTILKNTGFVVRYSDTRRNPLWVAYRVFSMESPATHERPRRFQTDRRTVAQVKHGDYTRSGFDRGHMAPNYAIVTRYGRQAQLETFLMSNICPQKSSLNRYVWKELEMLVAKRYASQLEEVWVVCGLVFDNDIEKLASGVEVPDAFYKIIVDENDGKARVLAFIMPQGAGISERSNLGKFLTSVNEVERETGLDFLHELSDDVEDRLEADKAGAVW